MIQKIGFVLEVIQWNGHSEKIQLTLFKLVKVSSGKVDYTLSKGVAHLYRLMNERHFPALTRGTVAAKKTVLVLLLSPLTASNGQV